MKNLIALACICAILPNVASAYRYKADPTNNQRLLVESEPMNGEGEERVACQKLVAPLMKAYGLRYPGYHGTTNIPGQVYCRAIRNARGNKVNSVCYMTTANSDGQTIIIHITGAAAASVINAIPDAQMVAAGKTEVDFANISVTDSSVGAVCNFSTLYWLPANE